MKTLQSERGQAMVLIVLAIIGLFAVAALAIDMGQVYSARRSAQNAADAAALAAAYESAAGSGNQDVAVGNAYGIAAVNGYDNNEETNWVRVNNPPVDGPYCGECGDGNINYFQVKITVRPKPVFAQFIFNGLEEMTVESIAHASTGDTVSSGNALFALDDDYDKALNMDGNTSIRIESGGNIRSNSGMRKNGGSGTIEVQDPGRVYYPPLPNPNNLNPPPSWFKGSLNPFTPADTARPREDQVVHISSFPDPACPKNASEASSWSQGAGYKYKETNGVTTYYYNSGLSVEDLPAGIHCINGGIGKGNYTGHGVLIVLLSGGIQQTGNDSIDFRAATDMKDANGVQWGGMVLFAPSSNTSVMKFGGNTEAYLQGTFFAPGADCDLGGTSDSSAFHASFICQDIKVHGNPTLVIDYKPEEQYHFPPLVELVQ